MAKAKTENKKGALVYQDFNGHTCLKIGYTHQTVHFIPLCVEGLKVEQLSFKEFDERFNKALVDYPTERACQLYAGYARDIGATPEVLDFLSKHTTINEEMRKVIMARSRAAAAATAEKATTMKPTSRASKATAVKPKAAPKAAAKPRAVKSEKASGERKPSAAQLFQDLIMEGKLSDEKIFEKVQKEYGLDDKKRSYVGWYRNHLRKAGKNPPDAK